MTSHFNGEDLVKRSLFSSIIGLKAKSARQDVKPQGTHNPWSTFDETTQACSTSQLRVNDESATDLPEQMEDTLLLRSPTPEERAVCSPQDIYHQIVSECAPFEQFQNASSPHTSLGSSLPWSPPEFNIPPPAYQPIYNQTNSDPLVCPNCFCAASPVPLSQLNVGHLRRPSQVSLEELVKMVVTNFQDSVIQREQKEQSPEEILRRKRQQNNEAAARYRKRQKEEKVSKSGEFENLVERNQDLRQQIKQIQKEMALLRQAVVKERREQ